MTDRQRVETTYADLRESDLVVDKTGKAWPVQVTAIDPEGVGRTASFWLCDPVTKVATHPMTKDTTDTVTVSRIPSHADEAAKLEAEFPEVDLPQRIAPVSAYEPAENYPIPDTLDEAVANVATIADPEPLVEYTATEYDTANAATDEQPVRLPAFESMTPLEQRSHLYLLHGTFAADLKGRDELAAMHADAHRQNADGSLKSAYVPHVHEVA